MIALIPIRKVASMLEKEKEKENYRNTEQFQDMFPVQLLWSIINLCLAIFALYLSFKRNQGFNFGSFLVACCCSPCYIAYALAVPVN